MGTFTEAINRDRPQRGSTCQVKMLLSTLDAKNRAEVVAALEDPDVMHAAISRALRSELDVKVAAGTIGRHRNGECRCEQ